MRAGKSGGFGYIFSGMDRPPNHRKESEPNAAVPNRNRTDREAKSMVKGNVFGPGMRTKGLVAHIMRAIEP